MTHEAPAFLFRLIGGHTSTVNLLNEIFPVLDANVIHGAPFFYWRVSGMTPKACAFSILFIVGHTAAVNGY